MVCEPIFEVRASVLTNIPIVPATRRLLLPFEIVVMHTSGELENRDKA